MPWRRFAFIIIIRGGTAARRIIKQRVRLCYHQMNRGERTYRNQVPFLGSAVLQGQLQANFKQRRQRCWDMVLQSMTCSQRCSGSCRHRSQHRKICASRQEVQENYYTFNQTYLFLPFIPQHLCLYCCILSRMGRWRITTAFCSYSSGKRP